MTWFGMQLFDIANSSVFIIGPVAEQESSSNPLSFQTHNTELHGHSKTWLVEIQGIQPQFYFV